MTKYARERWHAYVDKKTAESYKQYFRDHGIYFEPSEDHDMVYISFYVNGKELMDLEKWIEGVVENG